LYDSKYTIYTDGLVTIIKLVNGLVYDQEDKNMMEKIISI